MSRMMAFVVLLVAGMSLQAIKACAVMGGAGNLRWAKLRDDIPSDTDILLRRGKGSRLVGRNQLVVFPLPNQKSTEHAKREI